MAELYEEWLVSPMSRGEYKELSDEEKAERLRLQKRINGQKLYQENREERLKQQKKYTAEHKEEVNKYQRQYAEEHRLEKAEYDQTPIRKKAHRISEWKHSGLQESDEELDRIYELYLNQELCYSCDIKLTRDGVCCATQACMDHDHITHRFRQICCRACNNLDSWMKYWC
tara:strand:- start:54 stop:566 length:513 start_codon:yes stop_codon:yes gene_type:complete